MIYLDNAATSFPKPASVYEEVLRCMREYGANPGRGAHDLSVMAQEKVFEGRQLVSKLFNIKNPFNVIFTCNATEGLNIGIKGVLGTKDHVITTVAEHNSVLRPIKSLSAKGLEITYVSIDKSGHINIKDIRKEIRRNTKLIIINHVSNVIGAVQDIESIGEIAKRHGILFMVDGSQSAGLIDIDVEKCHIDILAAPGHKALLGPQGTGILYLKEGIKIDSFIDGGTGSDSNSLNQPEYLPDKFESGTLNTPGIAGLCEGIKFINAEGMDKIKKHEDELVNYLYAELSRLPNIILYGGERHSMCGSVLSFNIDGIDSAVVGYLLNKKGLAVRSGYHCAPLIHVIIGTHKSGTVRVSPGYFNTLEEMEKMVSTIYDICLDRQREVIE